MRWLVIHPGPAWSVADCHTGIVEALRGLGEDVLTYDLDERIRFFTNALFETGTRDENGFPQFRKACTIEQALIMAVENVHAQAMLWWPHVVLGISAFFTPPFMLDVMRDRGMKVVLWHTEAPYQDSEQLLRAAHADLNLVNDPANIDAYRALGPAEYFPHSYRPAVHCPGPATPELKSDLAFVGTGFPSRVKFFEQMDLSGLDVLLAGGWPFLDETSPLFRHLLDPGMTAGNSVTEMATLDNEKTVEIYRSAKTGINFYRKEAESEHVGQGWACGPREIELAATGLWFARDSRPESDELFPMLPAFSDPAEASDLIRWAVAHEDARQKAAAAARAAVADRTFENNAKRLLRLLEA
ncbi:MAG: hypothetical protein J2P30_00175 [Actinobacteria bacterium]|nr:hypothetical protein [Actinomycetota bacterium]